MINKQLAGIQRILDEMVSTGFVAGVNCMVIHEGVEKAYFQAGSIDLENQIPISRDTIFRLYSMTKPITAAAIMMLMDAGRIDLLDEVALYLPGFKDQMVDLEGQMVPVKRPVTLHDLLSMTSGVAYPGDQTLAGQASAQVFDALVEGLYGDTPMSTLTFANRLGQCPLAFQPGEHWQYGASADILGAIVEVVSGMGFGAFLEKNIFQPLEMKDTALYVPQEKRNRFSKVYMQSDSGLVPYLGHNLGIMNDMIQPPAFESGGAGLVSTIEDYANFTRMLMAGGTYKGRTLLSKRAVEFMTQSRLTPEQEKDLEGWSSLKGFTYGNLMRILVAPEHAILNGSLGEYGWDGWLGAYFANEPKHQLTFLMMMQLKDSGTTSYTRKLRNVVSARYLG